MNVQELQPNARRAWLQFSLRMLLLSMTCCALAIACALHMLGTPRPGGIFRPTYQATTVRIVSLPGSDDPLAYMGSHLTLDGNDAARLVQSREFLEYAVQSCPEVAAECRKDGATDAVAWLRRRLQTSASQGLTITFQHFDPHSAALIADALAGSIDHLNEQLGHLDQRAMVVLDATQIEWSRTTISLPFFGWDQNAKGPNGIMHRAPGFWLVGAAATGLLLPFAAVFLWNCSLQRMRRKKHFAPD